MLNFLKQTRRLINAKEAICIVIGNESCDLDSVCSALCLAFLLENGNESLKHIKSKRFLPVLNIPRQDYPLKTEVNYLLQTNGIHEDSLTFRDELEKDFVESNEFILVDHHTSPFTAKSVAIYDHRPREASAVIPKECHIKIEMVGSCATLIAEEFLKEECGMENVDKNIIAYSLLRDTIVLDTVNFSPSAGRSTPKDEEICSRLECFLKSKEIFKTREESFNSLCKARADVSSLTASQLLRKDLKVLTNSKGNGIVALPGFPLQVQEFIKKTDAEKAVKDFAIERNCDVVILLGMFVTPDGGVERDIGLVSIGEDMRLRDSIEARLLSSNDPLVDLERYENCSFMGGRFYKQKNIKATRKHILPIVKDALEIWKTD